MRGSRLWAHRRTPHRSWEFIADGVPLAIDLRSEHDTRRFGRSSAIAEAEVATVAERILPMLTGYRPASTEPVAALDVRLDRGAVTMRHRAGSPKLPDASPQERPSGWVGFQSSTTIADPLYVPFAVDQWISDASLASAPANTVRLHAAGFELDGETWLVVGDSGSGKSTVALRALAAGATYLSDERMTVHRGGRVTGLRRPVRSRDTHETVRRLVGEHQPIGRDAFRTLVPAEMTDDSPRSCSRLVLFSDDDISGWTRPAVVRALARSSQDLAREGPAGLIRLCELAASASVWICAPRSVEDLRKLGPAALGPLNESATVAELSVASGDGPSGWEVTDGVSAVSVGAEAVVWVPGPQQSVIGLNAAATDAWRSWAGSVPDHSQDDDFCEALEACGVLQRAQPHPGGHQASGSATGL